MPTSASTCRFFAALIALCVVALPADAQVRQVSVPPTSPGLTRLGTRPGVGRLLREGAFLPRARGRLRKLNSGQWAFLFDPDLEGGRLTPMLVMPCMTLAAMEEAAGSGDDDTRFVISGQVFVYHGRNYLLPTSHAASTGGEVNAPAAGTQADAHADAAGDADDAQDEPTPDDEDPSVETLIKQLEEATPVRQETPIASGASATGVAGLLREGTLLPLRRGRVVRDAGGAWTFITDNDADDDVNDARSLASSPMTLLPDENLMGIEKLATLYGEELSYRLSGRVFVYHGRNYLLPTMFVVDFDPAGNLVLGR